MNRLTYAAGWGARQAVALGHVGWYVTFFAGGCLAGRTLARAIQYVGDARGRCPR